MDNYNIPVGKKQLFTVHGEAFGSPVPLDGPPSWGLDSAGPFTVTPAPDGLSAYLNAPGSIGPVDITTVTISANASPTEVLHKSFTVTVVPLIATELVLTPGPIE